MGLLIPLSRRTQNRPQTARNARMPAVAFVDSATIRIYFVNVAGKSALLLQAELPW